MFTHANCSTDFAINLTKCDCEGSGGGGLAFCTKEVVGWKRGSGISSSYAIWIFYFALFICKINYKYYVLDNLLLTSRLQIVQWLIMDLGVNIYRAEWYICTYIYVYAYMCIKVYKACGATAVRHSFAFLMNIYWRVESKSISSSMSSALTKWQSQLRM